MSKPTKSTRTQRRIGRTRRGYALVLFVFLIWAFVGLAALVIDLRFVRLTQRQMQTAADAAALDALRDVASDPAELNLEMQERQALGPRLEFEDGIAIGPFGFNAAETIVLPPAENRQYRPRLVRNENVFYGVYDLDGIFTPSTATDANAVRVGLSRSPDNPDANGGPLPSLFARASLAPRFTVRHTSIAAAGDVSSGGGSANPIFGRAVAVGPPNDVLNVRGYAPFAVRLETWNALPPGDFEPVNEENLAVTPDAEFLHIGVSVLSGGSLSAGEWYIPIFNDIDQQRMVVGFGFGTVVGDEISRDASPFIASENATASFKAVPQDVPPEVLTDVLEASEDLLFPLVCPVLVQRFIDSTRD